MARAGASCTAGSGGKLTLVEGGGILQAKGQFSPGVIHQSIGGGGGWIGSVPAGTVQLGGLSTGTSTGADLELILPFQVITTAHSDIIIPSAMIVRQRYLSDTKQHDVTDLTRIARFWNR